MSIFLFLTRFFCDCIFNIIKQQNIQIALWLMVVYIYYQFVKLSHISRGVLYDMGRWGRFTPCFKTGGAYAPTLSMPHLKFEIVCFCPTWKKLSGGADGADANTLLVPSYFWYFPTKVGEKVTLTKGTFNTNNNEWMNNSIRNDIS